MKLMLKLNHLNLSTSQRASMRVPGFQTWETINGQRQTSGPHARNRQDFNKAERKNTEVRLARFASVNVSCCLSIFKRQASLSPLAKEGLPLSAFRDFYSVTFFSLQGRVKLFQSCLTLCDPTDGSPPGSSVHGILQTRILEWFVQPSLGELPDPGIEPMSLKSPALRVEFFTTSTTWEGLPLSAFGGFYSVTSFSLQG